MPHNRCMNCSHCCFCTNSALVENCNQIDYHCCMNDIQQRHCVWSTSLELHGHSLGCHSLQNCHGNGKVVPADMVVLQNRNFDTNFHHDWHIHHRHRHLRRSPLYFHGLPRYAHSHSYGFHAKGNNLWAENGKGHCDHDPCHFLSHFLCPNHLCLQDDHLVGRSPDR